MNIVIREGNINDYGSIKDLVKEVHDLHVKNRPDVYVDVENPFEKEQFEEILNSDNTKLFVAVNTDNKEVAAYSIIQIMNTKSIKIVIPLKFIYLDDLCVKSSYRRRGIGKMLFEFIKDYAKLEGASSVQLNVWDFNKSAIKFYKSLGMTVRNMRMELNIID